MLSIDSLGRVITFLQNQEDVNLQQFDNMVRLRPILSGNQLSVGFRKSIHKTIWISFETVDDLVQMVTLCSMLIGPNGNFGFYYVGRVKSRTKEEGRDEGRYDDHIKGFRIPRFHGYPLSLII